MDSNKDNLDIYYLWDVTIKNRDMKWNLHPQRYEVAALDSLKAYDAAFEKARRDGQNPEVRHRAFIIGIAFAYDRTAVETSLIDETQIAELWRTDPHNPNKYCATGAEEWLKEVAKRHNPKREQI